MNAMLPIYSATLLALAYLFHRAALKTRGKGSWGPDRILFRMECYLQATALLIWFL